MSAYDPVKITAAKYMNVAQTGLLLTTTDRGLVCVYAEHAEDWEAALAALQSKGLEIAAASVPDPKLALKRYAAAVRFSKEAIGASANGVTVQTDAASFVALGGKAALAAANASYSAKWKLADGSFAAWNASQIGAAFAAVDVYRQSLFDKEAAAVAAIDAGSATTTAQVDALMA